MCKANNWDEEIDLPGEIYPDRGEENKFMEPLKRSVKEKNMKEGISDRKLLKVEQVAYIFSMSESTIYAYVDNGSLKAIRMPLTHESQATKRNKRTLRFRQEDIAQFLKECSLEK